MASFGDIATSSDISSNDIVAHRLKQYRHEISKSINPKELLKYTCAEELTEMELLANYNEPRTAKTEALLIAVESSSKPNAFVQFVQCIEKEKEHLGHLYVAKLLWGTELSTDMHNDMNTSVIYREKCKQNIDILTHNINAEVLVPILRTKGLLTLDECQRLTDPTMLTTNQDKVSFILSLLETKEPTAHLLFVKCLEQESENPSHKELLQLFDIAQKDRGLKRKATKQFHTVSSKLPKFILRQTIVHGAIVSQKYLEAVEKIHVLQYSGNCITAITEVERYKSIGEFELYVALMCRNWYAYVNCHKSAHEMNCMVEEALKLLQDVDSDNRVILESRCEWMLSKYYWYMNDKEKAKQHIDESMSIQAAYQVAPGEDTLLTHYGKACTLLDTLTEQWSPKVAQWARRLIQNANDFAVDGNYGLYLSHHCIRLAQISLRSSPQCPGVCEDPNDLKEAVSTLRSVNANNLSPRTKCLFYITYSDYYRNMDDSGEALHYVQMAHDIAKSSGFDTELRSIEKRFNALKIGE